MKREMKLAAVLLAAAMAVSGCAGTGKAPTQAPAAETKGGTETGEQTKAEKTEAEKKETAKTEAEKTEAAKAEGITKLDQDVTIFVTVKPGGILDVRARALAPYLAEELGVGVSVKNVAGGGGVICATQYFTEKHGLMIFC